MNLDMLIALECSVSESDWESQVFILLWEFSEGFEEPREDRIVGRETLPVPCF